MNYSLNNTKKMVKRSKKMVCKSFVPGWRRALMDLPRSQYTAVRARIMDALALDSDTSWRLRLNGRRACSPVEYDYIERVFKENGIRDVFGAEGEIILVRGKASRPGAGEERPQ